VSAGKTVRSEADDATRGSAIRLLAEVASRLLLYATTWLLARGLGPSEYGLYVKLSAYALLLAELGELGLQVLASRVLISGSVSLGSLLRARFVLAGLVAGVALGAVPGLPWLLRQAGADAPAGIGLLLSLLIAWLALSGWGEFLGVALRCRGARSREALLLLALRAVGLPLAALPLALGAGLRGVALGLALSPLPALALGAWWLARTRELVQGPAAGPAAVLRQSAPLAVYAALLLLSPRIELFVLAFLRDDRELGLFTAGLSVIWFLAAVPGAIAAGAMPALTREARGGDDAVRRRTAATLALLAAPAGVGLALVAPHVPRLLFGSGLSAADNDSAALPLRIMAAAVPALFQNGLVAASLNAAEIGRAHV
jgi:O-antigen/teichoic acid export membrane protein